MTQSSCMLSIFCHTRIQIQNQPNRILSWNQLTCKYCAESAPSGKYAYSADQAVQNVTRDAIKYSSIIGTNSSSQ